MQNGWTPDGRRNMVRVSDSMSKDCGYARFGYDRTDPGCVGCKWGGGLE